ncbi:MAB_1171c family putative transporter [Kitasatospora sp. NPDC006697]|uniref:MAB_1171c family putative transporter n=1 Tax=Kitasatospora sp. NPDC006697 TaxID=3364020 RepID=UPI0036742CC6
MAELGPADLAAYLSAALFLLFAVLRLGPVRAQPGDHAQRYAVGFAFCMGGGLVALAPATLAALRRLGGGPDSTILLGDALKTTAVSLLVLIALVLRSRGEPAVRPGLRRRIRWQLAAALAVPAVMALCLHGAHAVSRGGTLVVRTVLGRWSLAGYTALFAAYLVCCLAVLGTALARQTRRSGAGLVRTGLRLMTAAAGVGMVWSLWALDDIADILLHGSQSSGEDAPSNLLAAVCAALAVGGATVTVWGATRWGARLTAPLRWLRARRRYRALEPLWSALHTALPGIALAPAARRRPPLRTAEFALYRRIIEIRDGQLALRSYLPAELPQWIADSAREACPHAAVLEAAALAAALEARRRGRPQPGPADWLPEEVAATVDAESAWLLQVAAAFTTCDVVAQVRHRAAAAQARSLRQVGPVRQVRGLGQVGRLGEDGGFREGDVREVRDVGERAGLGEVGDVREVAELRQLRGLGELGRLGQDRHQGLQWGDGPSHPGPAGRGGQGPGGVCGRAVGE